MKGGHWEQETQEQSTQCKILMTLAYPFTLQEEKEEEKEEVEEIPIEEIAMVPRGRRSSYAFSHQEGYANLITQGTILRRITGVSKYSSDEDSSSINIWWIIYEHQVTLVPVEDVIPGGQ